MSTIDSSVTSSSYVTNFAEAYPVRTGARSEAQESVKPDERPQTESAAESGSVALNEMQPVQEALEPAEESEGFVEAQEALLDKASEIMNELNVSDFGLSFSFDRDYDTTVINVTDKSTDDLVRQIPSEDFLKLAANIEEMVEQNSLNTEAQRESLKGLLFDEKV